MKQFRKIIGVIVIVLALFSSTIIWAEEKLTVKETIETYKVLIEVYKKQDNTRKDSPS